MNRGFFKWVADIINGDNPNTKEQDAKSQENKPAADSPTTAEVKHDDKTVIEVTPQKEEAPAEVETPAEEPAAEEKPTEEPAAEEKPAEEPAAEEKPAEEPAVEEKPAEEPVVEEKPSVEERDSAQTSNNNNDTDKKVVEKKENGIKRRDDFIQNTIATIKAYYRGTKPDFTNKQMRLWITDVLFFDTINNRAFIEELKVKLHNETGYVINTIEIKCDALPEQHSFTPINGYAYLELLQIEKLVKQLSAVIKVIEGCGSTIKEVYYLNSEEIQQLSGKRYNIGAGSFPLVDNILHRENHIAIDDNPQSPQHHNNKYVSRTHAHIEFSEEYGFQLYVDKGGTSMAQKRTQIQRNMEIIPVDNVLIPITLNDGDFIILSKHVSLKFNIINK